MCCLTDKASIFRRSGTVADRLTQAAGAAGVKVDLTSPLPLGCGFGLSGAASLATAYALNELLHLGKDMETLAMIAHVAEVENRTGLGDVCSQYHGGVPRQVKRRRAVGCR